MPSLYVGENLFDIDRKVGLKARINDKLNRIKQVGLSDDTEDTLKDLIIYLVHLDLMNDLEKK